jgi:hypothetical protein
MFPNCLICHFGASQSKSLFPSFRIDIPYRRFTDGFTATKVKCRCVSTRCQYSYFLRTCNKGGIEENSVYPLFSLWIPENGSSRSIMSP